VVYLDGFGECDDWQIRVQSLVLERSGSCIGRKREIGSFSILEFAGGEDE
jgi:hypothetical protein